jgi:hypothetical protein
VPAQCLKMAVRPEGANYLWRKNPPRELSIDLVADEAARPGDRKGRSLVTKVALGVDQGKPTRRRLRGLSGTIPRRQLYHPRAHPTRRVRLGRGPHARSTGPRGRAIVLGIRAREQESGIIEGLSGEIPGRRIQIPRGNSPERTRPAAHLLIGPLLLQPFPAERYRSTRFGRASHTSFCRDCFELVVKRRSFRGEASRPATFRPQDPRSP